MAVFTNRSAGEPAVARQWSGADRFMRRLLRVGDDVDTTAVFGARRSMTGSILVSAVRCTITYLVIPIVTPFIGFMDLLGAPLSVALCLLAAAMGITSVRRFWMADHRARWSYTAFIGVVLVALSLAVVMDVATIVTA